MPREGLMCLCTIHKQGGGLADSTVGITAVVFPSIADTRDDILKGSGIWQTLSPQMSTVIWKQEPTKLIWKC